MSNDPYGIRKLERSIIKKPTLNTDVTSMSNMLKGSNLSESLDLKVMQPKLDARVKALNTNTVNTNTIGQFIEPIQGAIEGFIGNTIQQTGQAVSKAQKWTLKLGEARKRRREEQISNLIQEAVHDMREGQWRGAINKLDKALKIDKKLYVAIYLKVICYAGMHDLDGAIDLASEGMRKCDEPGLHMEFERLKNQLMAMRRVLPFLKGLKSMRNGDFAAATHSFAEALSYDSEQPEIHFLKARAHLANGELLDARDSLEGAKWSDPTPELLKEVNKLLEMVEERITINDIQSDIGAGEFYGALDSLEHMRPKYTSMIDVYFYKALCHVRLGNESEAKAAIREVEKLDKSGNMAQHLNALREQLESGKISADMEEARGYMESQNWRQALSVLNKVEKKVGRNTSVLALIHYYKAICNLQTGDEQAALSAIRDAERHDTNNEMRQYLNALKQQIESGKIGAELKEAQEYVESQQWQKALSILNRIENKVSRNDPVLSIIYYYKAVCYLQTGDKKAAMDALKKARKSNPDSNLSKILDQMEDSLTSSGLLEEAMKAMQDERWPEALSKWMQIISKGGESGNAYYYAAVCAVNIAGQQMQAGEIDQETFKNYLSGAKQMLDNAEKHTSSSERELLRAISNLRSQLP